jgi:hypothetical protein
MAGSHIPRTPIEIREAALRLIQDGESCGGVANPYRHSDFNLTFDEIAVGDAYLAAIETIDSLQGEILRLKGEV